MKKILIPTLLLLIVSCQKNTSKQAPARSYTDSITEQTEKISKTDTVEITEKEKNNDKITEFKNEPKLKNLSKKDFNFIIGKLLEGGFGLTNYTYLDFDKIDERRIAVGLSTWDLREKMNEIMKKKFGR